MAKENDHPNIEAGENKNNINPRIMGSQTMAPPEMTGSSNKMCSEKNDEWL